MILLCTNSFKEEEANQQKESKLNQSNLNKKENNFIPEDKTWIYYSIDAIVIIIALVLIIYFIRKGLNNVKAKIKEIITLLLEFDENSPDKIIKLETHMENMKNLAKDHYDGIYKGNITYTAYVD